MRKAGHLRPVHADPAVLTAMTARGSYLTDERRLLHVVGRFGIDDSLVEVEDCATFERWLAEAGELAALRRVRSSD